MHNVIDRLVEMGICLIKNDYNDCVGNEIKVAVTVSLPKMRCACFFRIINGECLTSL